LIEGVEKLMMEGGGEGQREGQGEGQGGGQGTTGLCVLSDGGSDSDINRQHQRGNNSNTITNNSITPNTAHKNFAQYDAISCIEVIEHLPSERDAALALERILCHFHPNYAIFSTPNYESNRAIRMAADGFPFKKHAKQSELTRDNKYTKSKENFVPILGQEGPDLGCVDDNSAPASTLAPESFRESDHKFEFTRQEFRDWAYAGLRAAGGQYEVQFTEVGCRLPGMGGVEGGSDVDGERLSGVGSGDRDGGEGIHRRDGAVGPGVCGVEGAPSDPMCVGPDSDSGRYVDTDGSLKRSRERGCGGASQVAIFRLIKHGSVDRASTYAYSDDVPVAQEEKPASTLFWKWSRNI
jgi:hypothetical protein